MSDRIKNAAFKAKIMSAADAAALIKDGDQIGFAGFTGAGYPKEFPIALATRIKEAHARGESFKVNVLTGASTAPELDGALAEADGVNWRAPYQSDPIMRNKINEGSALYSDLHLSHHTLQLSQGFFGPLNVAVVEAAAITPEGELIPTSSVGANRTYLEMADKIIIEVNTWQSEDLFGMHDIYYGTSALPPHREPIPITATGDLIGQKTFRVDLSKVVAVIETDSADRNSPFKPLDDDSKRIAGHLLDWLDNEVKQGRLSKHLNPLQSGVGNIANAVLAGLKDGPFENLTSYTEVIQDGMIDLIDSGKVTVASATSFSLSPEMAEYVNTHAKDYIDKMVLRPQDVSNHPEVIRRLGVIACNGMIEADIYGNVNSTHIMGSKMMNGIGGSGDFTRNAWAACFVTPSTAKNGAISAIVPMVSHHDHTEHDVDVIITEQGLADLRGLAPRQRTKLIIENCAHPDYRAALTEYVERAAKVANGMHTPHDFATSFSFHQKFLADGTMQ
ncbi:MAG: acetyl-CoA hydrolase/transferase family protein [Propionibacteriaceae bacterium]